jgi:hypothetical protein
MRVRDLFTVAALLSVMAARAAAQEEPARPENAIVEATPVRPSSGVAFRALGFGGMSSMSASASVAALALNDSSPEFGGGAEMNLWRGLFVQGTFSRQTNSGERVFIDSTGARFPLGLGLDLTMNQIDIGAGWRFSGRPSATGKRRRLVPFAGGGVSLLNYEEASPFPRSGDDLSERFTGYQLFGGIDLGLSKWLALGGQVRYRAFADALGQGGVSAALDESDLGGISFAARVSIGRW